MNPGEGASWRRRLPVLVIAAAGFGLTLRIFYPGVMTYDAAYIHSYIAAGRAGDWQSPLMTALWGLVDPIAPGAGSMFIVIAALYWLAFSVLALALARKSPWLGPAALGLALMPPAFVFVGIIWRDILLAESWLLAAALAYAVAERRGVSRAGAGRLAVQALALGLLAFGFLLRPNALFAAPILAAYVIWPERFDFRRAAILYVPAALALALLMPLVYYGLLDARHENPQHAIFVFDLGGITHFTGANQFPVTWSATESAMVTGGCYQPTDWDIYWTRDPCRFVMKRLEDEKIFGTSTLTQAWLRTLMAHPLAYLEHRVAVTLNFLTHQNLTMWTTDIAHPDQIVFADNPWFMGLKALHDRLASTPLFRAGTWLLLCMLWCALAWRRRAAPSGAFVLGTSGSAVVYLATFLPAGVAADFRYALWAVLAGLAGAVMMAVREASPSG